MISINVNVQINERQVSGKINKGLDRAQFYLDQQVLKDSNYYIPKNEGYLEKSGILHSKIGEGKIIWNTPYARRLFYGTGYKFSKDKNPNASALWYYAAESQHKYDWYRIAQQAYDG